MKEDFQLEPAGLSFFLKDFHAKHDQKPCLFHKRLHVRLFQNRGLENKYCINR